MEVHRREAQADSAGPGDSWEVCAPGQRRMACRARCPGLRAHVPLLPACPLSPHLPLVGPGGCARPPVSRAIPISGSLSHHVCRPFACKVARSQAPWLDANILGALPPWDPRLCGTCWSTGTIQTPLTPFATGAVTELESMGKDPDCSGLMTGHPADRWPARTGVREGLPVPAPGNWRLERPKGPRVSAIPCHLCARMACEAPWVAAPSTLVLQGLCAPETVTSPQGH